MTWEKLLVKLIDKRIYIYIPSVRFIVESFKQVVNTVVSNSGYRSSRFRQCNLNYAIVHLHLHYYKLNHVHYYYKLISKWAPKKKKRLIWINIICRKKCKYYMIVLNMQLQARKRHVVVELFKSLSFSGQYWEGEESYDGHNGKGFRRAKDTIGWSIGTWKLDVKVWHVKALWGCASTIDKHIDIGH